MDKIQALYNAISGTYDVGSFDEFSKKIQDPDKAKLLYDNLSDEYDLGSFDEFSNKISLKKKDDSESTGQMDATVSQGETPSLESAPGDVREISERLDEIEEGKKQRFKDSFIGVGMSQLNQMIVGLPESVYTVASTIFNPLAEAIGLEATSVEKVKESTGYENPLLDHYIDEQKKAQERIAKYDEKHYETSSVWENIKKGNYSDALDHMVYGTVESAPVSVAMMVGGAVTTTGKLAAATTVAFTDQKRRELLDEGFEGSETELGVKALGLAAAESVFSSVNSKALGDIYKGILKKEGAEVGADVFKKTFIDSYKKALTKYGVPVAALGEGVEEVATQVTQNMIKGKPAYEGVADAFILGAGGGVAYGGPITASNAIDKVTDVMDTYSQKKVIQKIIEDSGFKSFKDVVDGNFTEKTVDILSNTKSRKIFEKELDEDQKKEYLAKFDDIKQAISRTDIEGISKEDRVKATNLLIEKEQLLQSIEGKEKNLATAQTKRINEIDAEIVKIAEESGKKYKIDGEELSKEDFVKRVTETPKEDLTKMKIEVKNDEEVGNIVDEKLGVEKELTPEKYIEELQATKKSDPTQYWSVDEVKPSDVEKGTIVSSNEGAAVVGTDGDIKGLFKKATSQVKGVADNLLKKAVDAGGIKLDNFDLNYLTPIYERNGFRVVGRMAFSEEHAPKGWDKEKHGTPDVVAMIYDPQNKLKLEEQTFDDYQKMMDYRDSFEDIAIQNKQEADVIAKEQAIIEEATKGEGTLYDNIYKAIEGGVSDKVIKEHFAGTKELRQTLADAKEAYATKRKKEEGLFDPKRNKVYNWLDRIYKSLLSKKSYKGSTILKETEAKDGFIESEVKFARKTVKRINDVLNNYPVKRDELADKLDSYIRGDENVNLPEELLPLANDMRMHMDNLSRKLVASGAVKANASRANILNNIGEYVSRSYQIFDDPNYINNIPKQVKESAQNKLREIYMELAEKKAVKTGESVDDILDEMVMNAYNDILDVTPVNDFVTSKSVIGSKNLSILKGRKEIPVEIRALLGEYGDIGKNYVRTVQKISTLVANQNFLTTIAKKGKGVFFYEEKTGEFNKKIAGDGSNTLSPLNGLYTSKEIAEALKESSVYDINNKQLEYAVNFLIKAVGAVKYTKTILSVGTHAKNFIGNIPFMVANWNLNPEQLNEAMKVLVNDIKNGSDAELNAKMDEYIRAGIISNSAVLGEIRSALTDAKDFDDIAIKLSDKKVTKRILSNIKKVGSFAETMYQAEDDFFKITAYESEKARYSKILFKNSFDKLTKEQQEEVLDKSAEVVKNTLPNYNRIGNMVKIMKAIPVAGTFISFQVEALRTAYNTVDLAAKEMKDPKTREIGVKRMAGIMTLIGGQIGLMTWFGIKKYNDDEDEDFVSSARKFLPPWNKYANIIIRKSPENTLKYISLSASDPHGTLVKAVNSYFSGETTEAGMINSIAEIFSPFISEDIFKATWTSLVENQNTFGQKIFLEGDTLGDKAVKTVEVFWKAFEPGTITSIRKISGSKMPENEIIGQVSGFKVHEVDLLKQTYYISRDISDRVLEVTMDFSKAKRQYKSGEITKAEAEKVYDEVNKKRKKVVSELIGIYKSAVQLGADPDSVLGMMNDAKIGKKDIQGIRRGEIPDM